jgi:hypothetical protein
MTLKEFLKLSNFGPIHTMFLDKHSGEIFTMDETDEAFLKRDMNLSKKLVDMSISDQIQYLHSDSLKFVDIQFKFVAGKFDFLTITFE